MTPAADPGSLSVTIATATVQDRLADGEAIIMTVRPSGWLILLMSWPLLVGVAAISAVSLAASRYCAYDVDNNMVMLICLAVGALRVTIACCQWQGRMYILTDRRVMRIKGVFNEDCYQCPLKKIRQVHLSSTLSERIVSVASLMFDRIDEKPVPDAGWVCLANPQEVKQAVEKAIRRAK